MEGTTQFNSPPPRASGHAGKLWLRGAPLTPGGRLRPGGGARSLADFGESGRCEACAALRWAAARVAAAGVGARQDEDPYVRKTAAVCVAKLYDINAEQVVDHGFLDTLLVGNPPPPPPPPPPPGGLHVHNGPGRHGPDRNCLQDFVVALGEVGWTAARKWGDAW